MRLQGPSRLLLALLSTGCFVTDAELTAALDRDGDGYLPVQTGGDDCDEGRADVNPGAPELCGDGLDNNCDGFPDDDGVGARLWFVDVDGDGYGIETTVSACTEPEGYAPEAGDCDDHNSAINPGVDDLCDGIDQDCDGVPDDEVPLVEHYRDADGDGIGTVDEVVLACTDVPGFVTLAGDCDDTDPTISPVATDLCDGIDQDCDGVIDDDAVFTEVFRDADGDGIGTDLDTLIDCGAIPGYVLLGGDCDDTDPTISPAAVDLCDGIDQDCDGVADDDALLTLYFQDNDGDGAGNPDVAVETCGSVPGFVFASGDCDDTDPGISPFILDGCDGIDQDCDGVIDEDAVRTLYFEDLDGDGVGSSISVEDCTLPAGHALLTGDCDDSDGSIHPGVDDFCDDVDQDCDGAVDEDASFTTWFRDVDGDGLGRTNNPRSTCDGAPSGYVSTAGDCNDTDATITIPAWYPDVDGDGVGAGTPSYACNPPADHEAEDGDCDDLDSDRYPGNLEVCGTWVDEDCDSETDCRWPAVLHLDSPDLMVPLPASTEPWSWVWQIGDAVGDSNPDYLLHSGETLQAVAGGPSASTVSFGEIPPCLQPKALDIDGDGKVDVACEYDDRVEVYLGGAVLAASPAMVVLGSVTYIELENTGPEGPGVWISTENQLLFKAFEPGTFDQVAAEIRIPASDAFIARIDCSGVPSTCLGVQEQATVHILQGLEAGTHSLADAIWSLSLGVFTLVLPTGFDATGNGFDELQFIGSDEFRIVEGPFSIQSAGNPLDLFDLLPSVSAYPTGGGDFDGDGPDDLVGISHNSTVGMDFPDYYQVFYGGQLPIGPFPDTVILGSSVEQRSPFYTDWNLDGREDFVIIDNDQQALLVIYGTGI